MAEDMLPQRETPANNGSIPPELACHLACELGEGPAWFGDERLLRFVDIKSGIILEYAPRNGKIRKIEAPSNVSFILPGPDESQIIGAGSHICQIRLGEKAKCLATIPQPATNRTNDATVDEKGRLWFGTMDVSEQRATGCLWCLDRGVLHNMGHSAIVTNGPAVSQDGRTLYHADSGNRIIWRHAIGAGPKLTESEPFIVLPDTDGYPDGIIIDAEGCLWVGIWDGWCARRYSPKGELLMEIRFPCARVTKIALGGENLQTAFATSARTGLSDQALLAQPLAGSLFSFHAPAAGLPLRPVRLR